MTRDFRWLGASAKLKPGMTLALAQAEMDVIGRLLMRSFFKLLDIGEGGSRIVAGSAGILWAIAGRIDATPSPHSTLPPSSMRVAPSLSFAPRSLRRALEPSACWRAEGTEGASDCGTQQAVDQFKEILPWKPADEARRQRRSN
jgi:hypothetical protein